MNKTRQLPVRDGTEVVVAAAHAVGPDSGPTSSVEPVVVVGADQRLLATPSTVDGRDAAKIARALYAAVPDVRVRH